MNLEKRIFFVSCFLIILLSALIIINVLKNIGQENKIKEQEEKENEILQEQKNMIEYKANQTIKVKICSTGEIIAMDVNDYLRGVLPSEMPPYYNIEALKAQAVVARTYLYRKMQYGGEGDGADICDNYAHCQAFYNKNQILNIWARKGYDENLRKEYLNNVNEAVVSTQNEVIVYNGQYIRAYFHASSPVRTESSTEIWGREQIPYLVSVENNESEEYANRQSTVEISYEDFVKNLNQKLGLDIQSISNSEEVKINEYTASGRVKNISVCGKLVSAEKLRTIFSLRSTLFNVECRDEKVIFNVIGNGHGLGLSQVGADYYGSIGMSYKDIIKHYYTGVDVIKID